MTVNDTDQTRLVLPSVVESVVKATWLIEADRGAVTLAVRLATELDNATELNEVVALSKALNDVLGSLGMNPRGRTGKAETPKEVNPLDQIIKAEAARERKATTAKRTATASKSRTKR